MVENKNNALTVIILTFNESRHIERAVRSAQRVASDVLVVDSFSTDDTVQQARILGARVLQHVWTNHANQLNWAIDNGDIRASWIMRLDADEYLTDELVTELGALLGGAADDVGGFEVNRRVHFMGQELRHGGIAPMWVLRFWRRGWARCEQRWMDEHIVLSRGSIFRLRESIVDDNSNTLTWWIAKHNRYASLEAAEVLSLRYDLRIADGSTEGLAPQAATKRWVKTRLYARLPLGLRAWLFFFYRIFFRLGVLDGYRGMLFHSLQGLWYRLLVDAKIMEVEDIIAREKCVPQEAIHRALGIQIKAQKDATSITGSRQRTGIRLLHVISTLAPSSGGPTQVLIDLAAAQAAAGQEVTVCTTDRDNPIRNKLDSSILQNMLDPRVELKIFPVSFLPLLFSSSMASWIRAEIGSYDIVHVHGLYRFPSTYACAQARRAGVPYVVTPHGALDPFLYRRSTTSVLLKRLYERWFDLPNLNGAQAIHYTTGEEQARAEFLKLRAPSFVLPVGLDWVKYRQLPARGALRARFKLGEAPVVLFLGRLHFKKGLDLLIPAFDKVRETYQDARLLLVGPENDEYGQKVRGWVAERKLEARVVFTGALYGADAIQAYVDADAFALPSYTENFGMTVAESMACRLPVVISDQVNIHQDVSTAGAGVVTRCDADEVAAALIACLRDPERRRAMGEAGRQLVQQRYTWSAIVPALTREYERVIACSVRSGS